MVVPSMSIESYNEKKQISPAKKAPDDIIGKEDLQKSKKDGQAARIARA